MTTNDIVHVPYKITREMIYDAIMQLEQYNKEHKIKKYIFYFILTIKIKNTKKYKINH